MAPEPAEAGREALATAGTCGVLAVTRGRKGHQAGGRKEDGQTQSLGHWTLEGQAEDHCLTGRGWTWSGWSGR